MSTNHKTLCEWLTIYCKGTGDLAKSAMSSPDALLMNGWYPVSRSLPKDTYAEYLLNLHWHLYHKEHYSFGYC